MTTTGGPTSATRLDSLTSLRAVAALAVFGIHAAHWIPGSLRPLVTPGAIVGVSFFFILSGVVLAWTMRPGDSAHLFYQRRFARIAPSYWTAALLAIPVLALTGALTGAELVRILPSLVFAQSWFPNSAIYFAGNGVGWSLSTEAFFYLTFPLFVPVLARLGTRALQRSAGGLMAMAVAVPALLAYTAPDAWAGWLVGHFPPVRLLEFVVGVALGLLLRRGALPGIPLPAAAAASAVMYAIVTQAPEELTRPLMVAPMAALLVAAARSDLAGRTGVLGRRWFVKLGEWSFCFYLVHQLVIKVVNHLVSFEGTGAVDHAARAGLFLGTLVLAVGAGAALHRTVEVPAERRLRPARRGAPASVGASPGHAGATLQE